MTGNYSGSWTWRQPTFDLPTLLWRQWLTKTRMTSTWMEQVCDVHSFCVLNGLYWSWNLNLVLKSYAKIGNYCKRGYFCWGKISRNCCQDISRGGNFHDTTPMSFIKAYGFYIRVGVIFAKKTKARKTRKLPPRENFHVYSIPKETSAYLYTIWKLELTICAICTLW